MNIASAIRQARQAWRLDWIDTQMGHMIAARFSGDKWAVIDWAGGNGYQAYLGAHPGWYPTPDDPERPELIVEHRVLPNLRAALDYLKSNAPEQAVSLEELRDALWIVQKALTSEGSDVAEIARQTAREALLAMDL